MTQRHLEHEPRDPLDFTPVPHGAKRSDGWTPKRQREFIETLASVGSVKAAAKAVGLLPCGAYKLRNKPGGESFAMAWDAAAYRGTQAVRDVMIDHALNGIPEPIFHAGKQVGERRRFNTRGQQWLIEKSERVADLQRQRAGREDPHVIRDRMNALMQKFFDAACDELQAKIDTDEKRAAFNTLWGSARFYPMVAGGRCTAESLSAVNVAIMVVGGESLPDRSPEDILAREQARSGHRVAHRPALVQSRDGTGGV